MPMVVTVQVTRPGRRPIRLWVPVLLAVLVLSPIVALAALAAAVACLVYRVDVQSVLSTGWRIVTALPGTRVDLEQGRTALLVTIR